MQKLQIEITIKHEEPRVTISAKDLLCTINRQRSSAVYGRPGGESNKTPVAGLARSDVQRHKLR